MEMFRDYVRSVNFPHDDVGDLMEEYVALPDCVRTGFPNWFLLKKLKPSFQGPVNRSEEQTLHDKWDQVMFEQIVKHM